jgi:hypothetical protein
MLAESRSSSTAARPRHTVRIVKRRLPPRAALISLGITACAAGVGFLAFRVWETDEPVTAFRPTIGDVFLTYRCERGDVFQSRGQVEPLPCPTCGRPAHPLATYTCQAHGDQDFLVQFAVGADGEPVVARLRALPHGVWIEAGHGPQCRCGAIMTRKPVDEIDFGKLKRREGEGSPRKPVQAAPERPKAEAPQPETPSP